MDSGVATTFNGASLEAILAPGLAPVLLRPERVGLPSAWWPHVPFAFWLIQASNARTVVELGTDRGVSYTAFCEAILRFGLTMRCHAIDTWQGERSGLRGDDIFNEFRSFHDQRYGSFSTPIRASFDEAVSFFEDGTIDILHIDGHHTYESVKNDFETWRPKLSDRAVVLIHNTNVREEDFGVWRFWSEISKQLPHFEFLHGFGLGVLAVGPQTPSAVRQLCSLRTETEIATVRDRFQHFGTRWLAETLHTLSKDKATARETAAVAERARLQKQIEEERVSAKAREDAQGTQLKQAIEAASLCDLRLQEARTHSSALEAQIVELHGRLHAVEADQMALLNSASWRVTAPLRLVRRVIAHPLRATRAASRAGTKIVRALQRNGALGTLRLTAGVARQQGLRGLYEVALLREPAPQLPQLTPRARAYPPAAHVGLLGLRVLIIAELSIPQCKKYRVDQKRDMIEGMGHDCTVVSWHETERARMLLQTHSVVIFYRVPAFPNVLSLMEEAEGLGLTCYFEIDDLVFDLDAYANNPNLAGMDPDVVKGLFDGAMFYRSALERCQNVIASTPDLARRMQAVGGGTSTVIENALDTETLRVAASASRRSADGKVRIVYGSGTRTHDADFAVAAQALARVAMRHQEVEILVVGDLTVPEVLLKQPDCIRRLPARAYAEYLKLLAEGDIAIAPLAPADFNDSKSNIKFLEAASVGIPTVCSPRSAFVGAVRDGETGFLAESEEEWFVALDLLVSNVSLRERMGEAARRDVAKRYSPGAISRRQLEPLLAVHQPRPDTRLHVMQVNVLYRPQSFGGATILVEALAQQLHARADTRVSIFTTAPAGWLAPYALERGDDNGIPVIRVGIQGRPGWFEESWDEKAGEAFREALRALRPDVVHFHAIQGLGAAMLDICRAEGIPFAVTLHDAWWLCERQFLVNAEGRYCGQRRISLNVCASCVPNAASTAARATRLRRALRDADLLLTPSEHWRRFYIDNGFPAERIAANVNGISLPAAPKPNAGPRKLRFGFVAGAEPVKGFPLLRKAFEAMERDDWELILVNHGLKLGHDSFAGVAWQVRGTVRTVPPYDPHEADNFFDGIDVLLFPSQWPESFGLTVREALARNKWVIATDRGGAAEAIAAGKNGTLIPIGDDPAPLCAAIEMLLDRTPDLCGWVNPYRENIRCIEEQAVELRDILARAAYAAAAAPAERRAS